MNGSISPYTGSDVTRSLVEQQIVEKYGHTELKNLDCYHNLRTFGGWLKIGFRVKKNEKAIRSFTITEVKDSSGAVIKKIKRNIFLFYFRQIEPVKKSYENDEE